MPGHSTADFTVLCRIPRKTGTRGSALLTPCVSSPTGGMCCCNYEYNHCKAECYFDTYLSYDRFPCRVLAIFVVRELMTATTIHTPLIWRGLQATIITFYWTVFQMWVNTGNTGFLRNSCFFHTLACI